MAAGCAYEVVAITTRGVPTITRISWRLRRHPAGFAVVAGLVTWLGYHLLYEQD